MGKPEADPKNKGIVRGFATNKTQLADLTNFGLDDHAIYLAGRGAEGLEACLESFRSRPGRLVIAHDLRVFGQAKRTVAEIMARLEKAQIHVTDILHPEDITVAQMVQRAQVAISGARFSDRRKARRMGAKGGLGKGVAAWISREGYAHKWLIDRIVDHREIPWRLKLELLTPHFSESTLRRRYGSCPSGQAH